MCVSISESAVLSGEIDVSAQAVFSAPMILIVSGGQPAPARLLEERARAAEMVIAADKGGEYCLEAGVIPDLVVGDMDSVNPELLDELCARGRTEVRRYPARKDETDTQIALEAAIAQRASSVEILCATGDRIDHTLANVHLLYRALRQGVNACLYAPTQCVLLVDSEWIVEHRAGALISLLPLTPVVEGLSVEGCAYPLTDARMELGDPYGVSNVIVADKARITVGYGVVIVILGRE